MNNFFFRTKLLCVIVKGLQKYWETFVMKSAIFILKLKTNEKEILISNKENAFFLRVL